MESLKYLVFIVSCANAAVIPEELTSLLNLIFSNIPPIKKGTNSSIGFGFSLGNHADFQVMFELGPQNKTIPIGTSYASSSKRQVQNPKKNHQEERVSNSEGGKYLSGWSQTMRQKQSGKPYKPFPIPEENPKIDPLGTVNLHDLLANVGASAEENTKAEILLKQPQSLSPVSSQTMTQLKQPYGQKPVVITTRKPFLPTVVTDRVPPIKVAKSVQNDYHNFERLAHFNVPDYEHLKAQKRKITAELSDVSLGDDE